MLRTFEVCCWPPLCVLVAVAVANIGGTASVLVRAACCQ